MKLIVGLGNPGKEYDGTRHNIGREIVHALADEWKLEWKLEKKLSAETARYKNVLIRTKVYHEEILLALPTTFMNDSGRSVQRIVSNVKCQVSDVLIVHDDLDLPLGTLRFSKGSGAAGQKGVQSIIETLGTNNFARLRIGVAGEHRATTNAADYVLKKFTAVERTTVTEIKKRALEALARYCTDGLAVAMNRYN